jgi:sulfite reductase (NADPH) flavoprotein alpha-component
VGLVTALPVTAVAVTGAALAFAPELHRWDQPELYRVESSGERMAPEEIVRRVRTEYPDAEIYQISLFEERDRPATTWLTGTTRSGVERFFRLHVDPFTGRVAEDTTDGGIVGLTERVHRTLAAGETGRWVVTVSSLALVLVSLVGLYLWWPMRRTAVRRFLDRRGALEWHNVVGLLVLPLFVVMGFTGLQLPLQDVMNPTIRTVTGSPPPPGTPGSGPPAGGDSTTVGLANAGEVVAAAYPDSRIPGFGEAGGDAGSYRVNVKEPDDSNPRGWERVFVDRYSGEILERRDTYAYSPASAYQQAWFQLHTGEFFGDPGRTLWALACLLVPVMAGTGLVIWLRKRRGTSRREVDDRPVREAA